jgi:hypothetical protein
MRIDTPYHHSVLFDQSEAGCSLSSSSYCPFPSTLLSCVSESTRSDISNSLLDQICITYTEAIPLHLARVFKATRSPSSNCLALPRTMATLVLVFGGTTDPSGINHFTLFISSYCKVERTSSQHKQRFHQRMGHQQEHPYHQLPIDHVR